MNDMTSPGYAYERRTATERSDEVGALGLSGFLLALVGGIIGIITALARIGNVPADVGPVLSVLLMLTLGAAALFGALWSWRRSTEVGAAVALAAGIGLVITEPEAAGLLTIAGAILLLVSTRHEIKPFRTAT